MNSDAQEFAAISAISNYTRLVIQRRVIAGITSPS
jgi:hypothetical protein